MQGFWWENLWERSNLEDLGVDARIINPLNAELYPTCHLLALLVARHILHVGRVRVEVDFGVWFWVDLAHDRGR
jgi:hypothetical protein